MTIGGTHPIVHSDVPGSGVKRIPGLFGYDIPHAAVMSTGTTASNPSVLGASLLNDEKASSATETRMHTSTCPLTFAAWSLRSLRHPVPAVAPAAELPVRTVVLYKHGVGYFRTRGPLGPGESARLDFKAEEMNDVLKSLTINDNGGKITGCSLRFQYSARPETQRISLSDRRRASL